MDITIIPLVTDAVVPVNASARTRSPVPSGYGVQEQCLPFTAASALGLLVRSPLSFGYCHTDQIPRGAHGLRSPLKGDPRQCPADELVFYVVDDPACQFVLNTFHYVHTEKKAPPVISPGLSFFDRPDQIDLFKMHLPYICRTEPNIDTLFLSPLNRTHPFEVLSGLVETDWYTNAVNLALRPYAAAFHISKGDVVAQMVLVDRSLRRPNVRVLADHSRLTRELRLLMAQWLEQHAADRSAYKQLARSRHGQFITSTD